MARLAARSIEIPYDYNLPFKEAIERYDEALKAAADEARSKNPGDMVGETIKWSVADGYAVYMVIKQKPLVVAHVDWGDGYMVDPIMIRGLRLSDVRQKVEGERKMREWFDGKKAKQVTDTDDLP